MAISRAVLLCHDADQPRAVLTLDFDHLHIGGWSPA